MKYDASIKSYTPDDEDNAAFDTWEEAGQWLLDMEPYHHGSGSKMINGRRVDFVNGEMVYDDLRARNERESAHVASAALECGQ